MFWSTGRSNFSFWTIPHQSPTYIFMFWGQNHFCPPQIQLESRRTGAVLTRRMATYNEVVLTKVAPNHTSWWPNHSKWLSRLPGPPKIHLESRRTGAVLTRRMATYNEVLLTKVASNHTSWWPNHSKWLSRLLCPPQIQLESRRTGAILTRRMNTYKDVVLANVVSNHQWVVQVLQFELQLNYNMTLSLCKNGQFRR